MESGTDYFITLNNTGTSAARICGPACCDELRGFVPGWNLHFFALQDFPVELAPGQVKKLWYFASLDQPNGFFNVTFRLWQCNDESDAMALPVTFGATDENFWGKETSYIMGTVTDEAGAPVPRASVVAVVNCGRANFQGESDSQGRYAVPLLGMEDIEAIYLGRDLACDSKDYALSVDQPGYEYYYASGFAPTRTEPASASIVLKKKTESADYALEWEKKVQDNFGFFWVKPSQDWSVFAAAQAKHPPELNTPTNFYLFDEHGTVLWKQPTGNECWGIDIARDGSKVVAGCHDGKIYVVDRSGRLLWEYYNGAMVRSACLSPDGSKVLSGGIGTLFLFDSATGAKMSVNWAGDWLRNCAFYADNSGFVVGARELGGFDSSGTQKWQYVIGEFPLFMAVDNHGNTYATGKSRTFFSFDANGNLRWTHKIAEPAVTAGAATPDGSRIAAGSVGGSVYLFDGNGTLLWKRGTLGTGGFGAVGHNAIAISQDGTRVVAGTDSNCIAVYDELGTMLWKTCIEPDTSNPDLKTGVTNVQISPDKTRIIASYGDNYVRMFRMKE
ncbi:Outer membrane protein assembly factor BamB [Candidatus Burarchaeum australiense]|nr:Outer membrane protein assembly factor BamB [Candidatus Burarchaeum australiense]